MSSGDEAFLESHRRDITVVFCDLRGFTPFAESAEPEDVMAVLGQYHAALGELVHRFEGTIEHFAGDGLMVFFNDPLPCPDAPARAVLMAVAMRDRVTQLAETWQQMGHDLQFGAGIAQGHATLGRVGFEGRYDYAAIGTVTNLAARLCDMAAAGQILVSPRVQHAAEGIASRIRSGSSRCGALRGRRGCSMWSGWTWPWTLARAIAELYPATEPAQRTQQRGEALRTAAGSRPSWCGTRAAERTRRVHVVSGRRRPARGQRR